MDRLVTHYYLPEDDSRYWVRLLFLTQDSSGKQYDGFGSVELPGATLDYHLATGGVIALKAPHLITLDQQLWLTPYGDVWLTTGQDPVADRKKLLLKRGENHGRLSKHEIIGRRTDQRISFVQDHYLKSQPTYSKFTQRVAAQLARQFGTTHLESGILASWEVLADFMTSGPDFLGLAYFLHPFREHQHGIVPFASLATYTFYFNKTSYLNDEDYHPLFDRELELHKRFLDAVKGNPNLRFGVITNTAATIEIWTYFQDKDLHPFTSNYVAVLGNAELLDQWLRRDPDNHVGLCDHNFAIQLESIGTNPNDKELRIVSTGQYEHGTHRTRLLYRKPLGVGFAYPKDDLRWAAEIRSATAEVIKSYVFKDQNYTLLEKELRKEIAAKLHSKEELCNTFQISEEVAQLTRVV